LEDLVGKDVAASDLVDHWGKPYQYNAQGANNGGLKPDIWTTTPRGIQVGNWPASR
jgi:hypothetical protein